MFCLINNIQGNVGIISCASPIQSAMSSAGCTDCIVSDLMLHTAMCTLWVFKHDILAISASGNLIHPLQQNNINRDRR